jgi:hypothetical protein
MNVKDRTIGWQEAEYDYGKIIEWEGTLIDGDISSGYVPQRGSGLTIGHGIDISRQYYEELESIGLSADALAQLKPYAATENGYGLTHPTDGGYGLLTKGHPNYIYNDKGERKVRLTDKDIAKLNEYFMDKTVRSSKISYNRIINSKNASPSAPKWEDLTPRQRTIMIDITHNAGPYFIEDSTTILKNSIATGNWEDVAYELEYGEWAEKDKPRHKKRAAYLNEEEYE